MAKTDIAIMWISEEDYPRFFEVFGPNVPPDHAAYEAAAGRQVATFEAEHVPYRKFYVDPDAMAEWCMDQFGRIDSKARSTYVATMALQDEGSGKAS